MHGPSDIEIQSDIRWLRAWQLHSPFAQKKKAPLPGRQGGIL